jgi:endonuclease YncB( thermonuclease family)
MIRWILAAAAFAMCPAACAPLPSTTPPTKHADLIGVASVIDGDTIEIRGQRIRLYGVDAFESGQRCRAKDATPIRCGQRSAMALDGLIAGSPVRCTAVDTDRYGRIVARCSASQTPDLSAAMVAQGWALAYRRYSQRYIAVEQSARDGGLGAWAGMFDPPAEWRAGRRTEAST